MNNSPFNPAYGSGQAVTSAASATVTINKTDRQVCITNTGGAFAYVSTGASASAADYPIPPGAQAVITKGGETTLSHFCASSTTLHIMTGNGW